MICITAITASWTLQESQINKQHFPVSGRGCFRGAVMQSSSWRRLVLLISLKSSWGCVWKLNVTSWYWPKRQVHCLNMCLIVQRILKSKGSVCLCDFHTEQNEKKKKKCEKRLSFSWLTAKLRLNQRLKHGSYESYRRFHYINMYLDIVWTWPGSHLAGYFRALMWTQDPLCFDAQSTTVCFRQRWRLEQRSKLRRGSEAEGRKRAGNRQAYQDLGWEAAASAFCPRWFRGSGGSCLNRTFSWQQTRLMLTAVGLSSSH